jgi:hypothetical protein
METKKEANAPKWGTKEWIVAYPWSQMDRKRRSRVMKAIGEEAWKDITEGPHTCCLLMKFEEVMNGNNIVLAKKDQQAFEKALCTVSKYEVAIYDELIGKKLAAAWKLSM